MHSKPGKDIRAQMIASFNVWLQVPEFALEIITRVIEMLHTSSLLYDPWAKEKRSYFLELMMWKIILH